MSNLFSSTGSFYVQDRSGNYYPATFLTYANGTPIVDNVLASGVSPYPKVPILYSDTSGTIMPNPYNYLVVSSADYVNSIVDRGTAYGDLLSTGGLLTAAAPEVVVGQAELLTAQGLLAETFAPKLGYGDAQYQTDVNGNSYAELGSGLINADKR